MPWHSHCVSANCALRAGISPLHAYSSPVPRLPLLALVALGGVLGAWGRLAVSQLLLPIDPSIPPSGLYFPWPTVIVNLVGCLVIGAFIPVIAGIGDPARAAAWRAFAVTGVLGGFTTFSAFASDSVLLARDQSLVIAAGYVGLTLAGGLAAVAAGSALAARRAGGAR